MENRKSINNMMYMTMLRDTYSLVCNLHVMRKLELGVLEIIVVSELKDVVNCLFS